MEEEEDVELVECRNKTKRTDKHEPRC